ncbi:MAG: hypothetical protein NVSMB6_20690 [Burkholderiaceae bacterium]
MSQSKYSSASPPEGARLREVSGGEAAGLVPSKTTVPPCLEVSFQPEIVRERRVGRLRRTVWACGHLHRFASPKGFRENVWFVTLTYRGVDDWRPGHVSACLKAVRKWCKRRGVPFRYVWVAELQKRGALHYHLAIWLAKRIQLPKFDKQGWWPHSMTQRVIAKNAVGYLMKYLSKITPFHDFPKGARIHGYGGLTQQARSICSWLNLPSWCKQRFGVGELRTVSGRRVVRETGEILAPMYQRVFHPAGMRLYPNGPVPERWADGPYSSIERFATVADAP